MSSFPSYLAGDLSEAGDLKRAVERRWSCDATLLQTVPVTAVLDSERSWDVIVHIFRLDGHPKAGRAYAWMGSLHDDSGKQRLYSALDIGPIKGPGDAVGAAIADELRTTRLALAQPKHRAALVGRTALFRAPALARLVN
ncbi:MAG: hypothetical protein JOY81_10405 [Alphaproteobacteria bacterium]|nr:hypothetical protein [Alphaproteobacteria bacterium]